MRDFYTSTSPAPFDQAEGLRQMFAGRSQRVIPLAANPYLAFSGVMLDHIASALVAGGWRVLVVDAADRSPPASELARLDLAAGIEVLSPKLHYLAAGGLPLAYVDTRGSASGFIDALTQAAPDADVVLLHANATDLARMYLRRAARPILLGGDDNESIKHAYAACKLLAQRCQLMTFDLLLLTSPHSARAPNIAASLAGCADGFLGALLHDWAVVDPAGDPCAPAEGALQRVLSAQMSLHDQPLPRAVPRHAARHPN